MEKTKEDLEKEKISLEINEIKTPFWRKTSYLTVAGAILVPLTVAIVSFFATRDTARDARIKELTNLNNEYNNKILELKKGELNLELEKLENTKKQIKDTIDHYQNEINDLKMELSIKEARLKKTNNVLQSKIDQVKKLSEENFYQLIDDYLKDLPPYFYQSSSFKDANDLILNSDSKDNQRYEKYILNKVENEKDLGKRFRLITVLYLNKKTATGVLENKINEQLIGNINKLNRELISDFEIIRGLQEISVPIYYETLIALVRNSQVRIDFGDLINLFMDDSIKSSKDAFNNKDNYFYILDSAYACFTNSNNPNYLKSINVIRNVAPFTFLSNVAETVINYNGEDGTPFYYNPILSKELSDFRNQYPEFKCPRGLDNKGYWETWKSSHSKEYDLWKGPDFSLLKSK